jgi:hypothetical protein
MELTAFFNQLMEKLKKDLIEVDGPDDLLKDGSRLRLITNSLLDLKRFVHDYQFKDRQEEISFFKHQKPILVSQHVYHKKIFEIKLFNSFRDTKSKQAYYYEVLEDMAGFIKRNREFHEYCITNAAYLDDSYFTRRGNGVIAYNLDSSFTTGFDTKLGKILGYELIKNYVIYQLQNGQKWNEPALTWTASKTDLTELIYALQSSKVFNNGSADVKLIASTLGVLFNVNIPNIYKTFQEIRMRKRDQTPFLDMLKKRLIQRVEESDT